MDRSFMDEFLAESTVIMPELRDFKNVDVLLTK